METKGDSQHDVPTGLTARDQYGKFTYVFWYDKIFLGNLMKKVEKLGKTLEG